MYRDASNYKVSSEVIFQGKINSEMIIVHLEEKLDSFVPSQIGLEDLQGELQIFDEMDYEEDTCWHELICIEKTFEEPTDERTIYEFAKQIIGHEFFEEEVGHILNLKNQKQAFS